MQWKARSQAANHGYSHLSGMEMTSRALRWVQSRLRPWRRPSGGGGGPGAAVVGGGLGARAGGVDRLRLAAGDAVVDAVLDERRRVGRAEQSQEIGVVLREQQRGRGAAVGAGQHVPPQPGVLGEDEA